MLLNGIESNWPGTRKSPAVKVQCCPFHGRPFSCTKESPFRKRLLLAAGSRLALSSPTSGMNWMKLSDIPEMFAIRCESIAR